MVRRGPWNGPGRAPGGLPDGFRTRDPDFLTRPSRRDPGRRSGPRTHDRPPLEPTRSRCGGAERSRCGGAGGRRADTKRPWPTRAECGARRRRTGWRTGPTGHPSATVPAGARRGGRRAPVPLRPYPGARRTSAPAPGTWSGRIAGRRPGDVAVASGRGLPLDGPAPTRCPARLATHTAGSTGPAARASPASAVRHRRRHPQHGRSRPAGGRATHRPRPPDPPRGVRSPSVPPRSWRGPGDPYRRGPPERRTPRHRAATRRARTAGGSEPVRGRTVPGAPRERGPCTPGACRSIPG